LLDSLLQEMCFLMAGDVGIDLLAELNRAF